MFTEERSDDYTPIAVVGTFSIYVTELLLIIHIASMIVFSVWAGFSGLPLGQTSLDFYLGYSPELIIGQFQIWRLFTFALQNYPSLGFVLGMLMLWWFGREVERFYGRKNFLVSYSVLVLAPALLGLLPIFQFSLLGPQEAHFGIFILFAATYPGIIVLFNLQVKWMAWAWLAIYSFIYLSQSSFNGLILLWLSAFLGYGMSRWLGRGEWLPEWLQNLLPSFNRPQFTVVKESPNRVSPERLDDPVSAVDPILEKIARSGLSSLTAREHAALRAASGELQKKNGG